MHEDHSVNTDACISKPEMEIGKVNISSHGNCKACSITPIHTASQICPNMDKMQKDGSMKDNLAVDSEIKEAAGQSEGGFFLDQATGGVRKLERKWFIFVSGL